MSAYAIFTITSAELAAFTNEYTESSSAKMPCFEKWLLKVYRFRVLICSNYKPLVPILKKEICPNPILIEHDSFSSNIYGAHLTASANSNLLPAYLFSSRIKSAE